MATKTFDVGYAVGGFLAGAKRRSTDVDGICTMVNGSNANFGILGRRKQLYLLLIHAAKIGIFGTMRNIFLFLQVISL